jgi:4-diphosphocytidyl-2-C-methyl-D-erythritol kinase
VINRYPAVSEALNWLKQYGEAKMSGTGACLFAAFNSKQQAEQIADIVPSDWQGFVAKGLNTSPLATMIKDHSAD